jgi:beta-lactamase superfamily II metal-dependent hydrolase
LFTIELLPAAHGDSLWIEYGDPADPRRILIDGGTAPTYTRIHDKLMALPESRRRFELLVISHVDADHIEGALRLLYDRAAKVSIGEVWFNGWAQLAQDQDHTLGPVQGEMVSALLARDGHRWNAAFDGRAIVLPGKGPPPAVDVEGLKLTVLSPGPAQLADLRLRWATEVRKAGLEPGVAKAALDRLADTRKLRPLTLGDDRPSVSQLARTETPTDHEVPNGSSIALLAEFDGNSTLLGADAHPDVLEEGIRRLLDARKREVLSVGAFKLPHHGSAHNVTTSLLKLVDCRRYLVSTNGAIFHHPDPEAIARVLVAAGEGAELCFNYRSDYNAMWADKSLVRERGYVVRYPDERDGGLLIDLES